MAISASDWQYRMQEPREDFKTRAVERAVKARDARPGAARTPARSGYASNSDLAFDKAIRDFDNLFTLWAPGSAQDWHVAEILPQEHWDMLGAEPI